MLIFLAQLALKLLTRHSQMVVWYSGEETKQGAIFPSPGKETQRHSIFFSLKFCEQFCIAKNWCGMQKI
jgi:hypothetical protein